MIIIRKIADENGAHSNQTWPDNTPPDGYYALSPAFESAWEQYAPFVTITAEDDIITSIADNPEARAAQAAIDAAYKPEPTATDDLMALAVDHEYRLTLLELGVI